ncbi:hypothetical protein HK405_001478 [Cladochytrium tenue]|nr:hypothetical protein HK405_001478 [Cladochytrium tenue]
MLAWAAKNGLPSSHVHSDGSTSNETRLGAVRCIALAVEWFGLAKTGLGAAYEGVLVAAGDTLFLRDFDLGEFVQLARATAADTDCLVTSYTVTDEETRRFGIAEVAAAALGGDEGGGAVAPAPPGGRVDVKRVVAFREKPGPDRTASRLACPCFYYFPRTVLARLLGGFMEDAVRRGLALDAVDATGRLLAWAVRREEDGSDGPDLGATSRTNTNVWAVPVSGRVDIGNLESYRIADSYFSTQ